MHLTIARIRSALGLASTGDATTRTSGGTAIEIEDDPLGLPPNCSWDAMRRVYEEQAARGVPEAIAGLERIREGRWPTSGRPRDP